MGKTRIEASSLDCWTLFTPPSTLVKKEEQNQK
jgi:hypothetical protein